MAPAEVREASLRASAGAEEPLAGAVVELVPTLELLVPAEVDGVVLVVDLVVEVVVLAAAGVLEGVELVAAAPVEAAAGADVVALVGEEPESSLQVAAPEPCWTVNWSE